MNVATAQLVVDGVTASVNSNVSTQPVDELLDIGFVTPVDPVPVRGDRVVAVPVALTNAGNGTEAFVIDASVTGTGATVEGIAVDRDGDGRFDPAIDIAVPSGTAAPALAPGATVQIIVLLRGATMVPTGSVAVTARAATGSGVPGTAFAGKGDGGVDAVVGATTAAARVERPLVTGGGGGGGGSAPSLSKAQQVVAPDGGDAPVVGAVVTYTITATFTGNEAVQTARIADAVPAGTAYVAGSLRLDGAALTDIADADPGGFDGATVAVLIGDVAAPATHTIVFNVTIQ